MLKRIVFAGAFVVTAFNAASATAQSRAICKWADWGSQLKAIQSTLVSRCRQTTRTPGRLLLHS